MVKKRLRYGVLLFMAVILAGMGAAGTAGAYSLEVTAGIDGSDYLYIQGTNVWWEHRNFVAVGFHPGIGGSPGNSQPTYLTTVDMGTVNWIPNWPSGTSTGDLSDPFTSLDKALAALAQTVTIDYISVREEVTIIEQPSAGNSYTLKVLFNDDNTLGSAWYSVRLNYEPAAGPPAPLPGTMMLLGSGLMGLLAWRRWLQG